MQRTPRHPSGRHRARPRLLSVTAAALIALTSGPAAAQAEAGTTPAIGVELNKLEQTGEACRSYMVLSNTTETALDQVSLDLVVFDTGGLIDRRLAVELGPLDAARTQVRVFGMPGLDCDDVARVLLNDVLACSPERVDDATTCNDALRVSARGDVDFIR